MENLLVSWHAPPDLTPRWPDDEPKPVTLIEAERESYQAWLDEQANPRRSGVNTGFPKPAKES